MQRRFFLILAVIFLVVPALVHAEATSTSSVQLKTGWIDLAENQLTARAALVMDQKTGKILYYKNPDLPWTIASLTKIMTSVVYLEQSSDLNKIVSLLDQDEVGGGRLRVATGTKLTMKDLLYCALVGSANNTATAMMRTSGLSTQSFLDEMNVRATTLGMKATKYFDPSGMNPKNVTSARDMALLARYAFANPTIRRAAQTAEYRFSTASPIIDKRVINTNALLLDPYNDLWILAGKTGYLEESAYNLVIRVQTMQRTKDIIVVVLGSSTKQNSFNDAEKLAKWTWKNYVWN